MIDIHSNLTTRLNYLIGLLDISSQQSYDKIKGHKIFEEFDSVGEVYNNEYLIYRNQITISSMLLGYAYFEAFLSDLIILCLIQNPKILIPEGKARIKEKTITYQQLFFADSHEKLVKELVDKEVRNIMYKSMSEILDFIDKRLKLKWNKSINNEIIVANKIRNCCMHNNCIADKSLAKDPRFVEGNQIELTASVVHSFGLKARQFSRELWESAKQEYFVRTNL